MKVISDEEIALILANVEIAKQALEQMDTDYNALAAKYDDALKRIADLQAEVEHLRREVNR
jgi:chromosome segregation ATPase